MSYMDTYTKWCTDSYFDEDTKKELKAFEGNDEEVKDRFYRQLEFGTGGLRGVIGAGTNRMSRFARHRNFLSRFASLDVLQVSLLLQAIIHASTTDTRFTGRMVHRLHLHTTRIFLQRLQR